MIEHKTELNNTSLEELLGLRIRMSAGKSLLFTNNGGNVLSTENVNLCTINDVGLDIIRPLLSGKTIGETLAGLSPDYGNTPKLKIEQETITFIRRLYARGLIVVSGEDGEVEIPSWTMEPVTDVHLFITHRCNLDCIHCLIVKEKREELTSFEFMGLIDDFVDLGCTHLDLTGGETTTKKGFLDIVDHACSKNLSVGVATNGTNWREEDLERLVGLKPEKVNISIYSTDSSVHDQITQRPGSFGKSLNLAQKLISAGIHVNFKCMVMRENFESYQSVKQLADKLGAGYQFDAHITSKVNGDNSPLDYRLLDSQLWEFINSPYCTIRDKKGIVPDSIVCSAGVDRASVNAYGDIHPCAVFPINVGNVKEKPLKEIWKDSPVLKEVRTMRFKDMSKCGSCALLPQCSPCPGASFLEQGGFRKSPEWSCKLTKMLVEVKKGGDKV